METKKGEHFTKKERGKDIVNTSFQVINLKVKTENVLPASVKFFLNSGGWDHLNAQNIPLNIV